jgi:hypothetical protein
MASNALQTAQTLAEKAELKEFTRNLKMFPFKINTSCEAIHHRPIRETTV